MLYCFLHLSEAPHFNFIYSFFKLFCPWSILHHFPSLLPSLPLSRPRALSLFQSQSLTHAHPHSRTISITLTLTQTFFSILPPHPSMQHPMNCLAFLKALNTHLRPEEKTKTLAENDKKSKIIPKKMTPGPVPSPGVRGTRTEGLQSMTSLSLTHAHMSRNTVLMLEVRCL